MRFDWLGEGRPWAAAFFLALFIVGCKDGRRHVPGANEVTPTIEGNWAGSMAMGTTWNPSMSMSLTQHLTTVGGVYAGSPLSVPQIGQAGHVTGLTTGQSFALTLQSDDPTCHTHIDINGYNDGGTDLAFNFHGVDCSSSPVSGQGYCNRPN